MKCQMEGLSFIPLTLGDILINSELLLPFEMLKNRTKTLLMVSRVEY